MKKICIFAGTTEGRKLAEFLDTQPVSTMVCVATQYGEELLEHAEHVKVSAERLPEDSILELLGKEQFDLVIDATHPYAVSVSENIRNACEETGMEYLRLLREGSDGRTANICVGNMEEAARYLAGTQGRILLTTGSKEVGAFSGIDGFEDRVYARVLPMESSIESCRKAGLKTSHIIAMQGPFTQSFNEALLKELSISWMVTKDGGDPGGFREKQEAAEKTGTGLVVVGRPAQTNGHTYGEMIRLLCSRYGLSRIPYVTIAGIGPGSRETMTKEVLDAAAEADCLIGAGRMLEHMAAARQETFEAISPEAITGFIREHTEYQNFTVLMSGDTGFFSGTRKLLEALSGKEMPCRVRVLPGISSLSCLCSRLGVSYEDVRMVSLHGREHDIVREVCEHSKVFVLVGGKDGTTGLCRTLTDAGFGDAKLSVGERLSYKEEKITVGTAKDLQEQTFDPLSAVLIEYDSGKKDRIVTHGLPDEMFERGSKEAGIVPMTKREIRSICLSYLGLTKDAVCWDIGAGTGSVAIEMALQASEGQVFAVEKDPDAAGLIAVNAKKLGAFHVTVVKGKALDACKDLPAPTHVFVGESSGNLRQILEIVRQKNPAAVIVVTAVTLETAAQLSLLAGEPEYADAQITSVNIAGGRKAGSYHLMTARNPVTIFCFGRKEA